MKKFIAALCVCVMMIFSLTACMEGAQLSGSWTSNEDGTGSVYTFGKDGKGTLKLGNDSLNYTQDITYSVEKNVLNITIEVSVLGLSSKTTTAYTMAFSKNVLTLTDENGNVTTLYKQK